MEQNRGLTPIRGNMKNVSSMPVISDSTDMAEPLVRQRRVDSDPVFLKITPLDDLPMIAVPGLHTRVMRAGWVNEETDHLEMFVARHRQSVVEWKTDLAKRPPSVKLAEELEAGWTRGLVWAAAASVIPAMQYGFNNGSMNTAAQVMRESLNIGDDVLGDNTWGFCISVFSLGALAGCYIGAAVADAIGRKRALMLNSGLYIVAALVQAASAEYGLVVMLLGRMMAGVASGASTVLVPTYLGEVAPAHLRGTLGTIFQLTCALFMLIAQVLGLPFALGRKHIWPFYMMVPIPPGILLFVFHRHLLESPRWLAGRSYEDSDIARENLLVLRGEAKSTPAIDKELDMMRSVSRKTSAIDEVGQNGDDSGPKGLCNSRAARKGLTICILAAVSQQFSGINNVFNYSSVFLSQNGLGSRTIEIIAIAMNIGNFLVTGVSSALMDQTGRKILLLGSSCGMVACIVLLTISLSGILGHTLTSYLSILSVVSMVTVFGVGMGPIPWLLPAEFFKSENVAKGSALVATVNWVSNWVVATVFPVMSNNLNEYCFLPFAILLVLFSVFVCRSVPETRGKTIDSIMKELSK